MPDISQLKAPLSDEQRSEQLWQLFDALIAHLVSALGDEANPPNAATLAVARKFLADNKIEARTRTNIYQGLKSLPDIGALPFGIAGKDDKKH